MTLVACEGSETSDDTDTDSSDDSCTDAAASGPADSHSHNLSIPSADIAAGTGGDYTSAGGDHDHVVTISDTEMATLRDTCTVTISSTTDHPHDWTLTAG
jgi:hypothetical protein